MIEPRLLLLTGASGYVGGRLLNELEAGGRYRLRCIARHPLPLRGRAATSTEVLAGDVGSGVGLAAALEGVDTAIYLIHSMDAPDFEDVDRRAAGNFAAAARAAGVRRVIYLGGLGADDVALSPHLRSRREVGDILRSAGTEVIELRASIVIGAGSLSFEMIRALVERLPVMITPRWVSVPSQPIGIRDLLRVILAAIELPSTGSRVFEVGGADVVSYSGIMREYAAQRGLHRVMIPVPVLTPRASSLWLRLITPLEAQVGRALIDSIRHPTVVGDRSARDAFGLEMAPLHDAVAEALADSRSSGTAIGLLVDSRAVWVNASPTTAFAAVRRVGGRAGWFFGGGWLWRVRDALDVLIGDDGGRHGRRDPKALNVGDVVDYWRVEAVASDRHLRLVAEARLPGRVVLDFQVRAVGQGSEIRQVAEFDPAGLAGLAGWYGVKPIHRLVLGGMLRRVARAAMRERRISDPA